MSIPDKWVFDARCGDYKWMCCLNADQLATLYAMMRRVELEEMVAFHRYVCCSGDGGKGGNTASCQAGFHISSDTGGCVPDGGGGGPLPDDQCIVRFRAVLCQPATISWLGKLKNLLQLIAGIPNIFPDKPDQGAPTPKFDPAATVLVIDAILLACGSGNALIQVGVIQEFCKQINTFRLRFDALPEVVKGLLGPILTSAAPNAILLLLNECCDKMRLAWTSTR